MLEIYNTLSQKREVFRPRKSKKVNLFVCGITPYDYSHIGHARTYIVFDMIAKYLKEKGFKIFYLQNITDLDDKIIERAKEEKIFWKDLSKKFEREYLKDMKALNINSLTKYARATDHIKEIISQVERLVRKDYAYQIKNGVYYDISKFRDYGKLSRRTIEQAEDAVSRIDEAKEKRNKGDFCLWKFSLAAGRPDEPKWKSPFGWGRPGWHIEDTAITEKYFGSQYDIHGGARDLIFPHHEAEIAQMEAISNKKPMVKYWLHTGFLTAKGVKMAKSLRNFVTTKDFLKKYSSRLLRFFVIKAHYRSPLDYNERVILQVKRELERIDEFLDKIQKLSKNPQARKFGQILSSKKQRFRKSLILKTQKEWQEAMEGDFNTPKAVAVVFNLITKGNSLIARNKLTSIEAKNILKFLRKIDRVFNFIFGEMKKEIIPKEVLNLVKEREKYREKGNWQAADEIRKKIKEMGYWIEDTKKGPKLKKIS